MKKIIKNVSIFIIIFFTIFSYNNCSLALGNPYKSQGYTKAQGEARDSNGDGTVSVDELLKYYNEDATRVFLVEDIKRIVEEGKISKLSNKALSAANNTLNNTSNANTYDYENGKYYDWVNKFRNELESRNLHESDNSGGQKTYEDTPATKEETAEKEKKKNYTPEEIWSEYTKNGNTIPSGCKEAWYSTLEAKIKELKEKEKTGTITNQEKKQLTRYNEVYVECGGKDINADSKIYESLPQKGDTTDSAEEGLDDMMNDADKFIDEANELKYDEKALQNFSKTFYNIMLTVGIVVAVLVGGFIGIKLMTSSVEEKADYKKLLVPYIVGCIVVFGGFTIWKIVVGILQGI